MDKKIVFSILSLSVLVIGTCVTLMFYNIFGTNENISLIESNKVFGVNDNIKNTYVDNSVVVPEDKIIIKLKYSEGDETIKLGDTEDVYDSLNVAVIGTIIEKGKSTASELSPFPYTTAKLKVDKVIKGKVNSNVIDIVMEGGTCTVAEFIRASEKKFPERIEKMGLNKLSDKEKQEYYIEYDYKYAKDFNVGNQYVVMLGKDSSPSYFAISNAGFLDFNVNNSLQQYSNYEKNNINNINTKEDILNMSNAIKLK